MNLKDAFRYQNVLSRFVRQAQDILCVKSNVTQEKKVYLHKKVDKDLENEEVITSASARAEYAGRITDLACFLVWLVGQQDELSKAISATKKSLDVDIDSESGLNQVRQGVGNVFRRMAMLRGSEVLETNGGVGYRFNAEGNQTAYKCDVRTITTIDFDRNAIKKMWASLSKQADEISNKIDLALVTSKVDFIPPFDVNENFNDVFEWFCEIGK